MLMEKPGKIIATHWLLPKKTTESQAYNANVSALRAFNQSHAAGTPRFAPEVSVPLIRRNYVIEGVGYKERQKQI